MVFADFIGDLLGWSCLWIVFVLLGIGWVCNRLGKAAGDALKSDTAREVAREAARITFWTWWFSDW
jgi:hypothetical protein